MKVAIYANITLGGDQGGVEQFVLGLINSLGKLEDGDEEYIIIAHPDYADWLRNYIGQNQQVILEPQPELSVVDRIKRNIPPILLPALRFVRRYSLGAVGVSPDQPPKSGGFFESLGVDVVHFPFQHYLPSSIPTVYNPHDLLHLHYPQLLSRESLVHRKLSYSTHCRWAQAIAVPSQFVKDDVIRQYKIEPGKVYSILYAAPTLMYKSVSDELLKGVQQKFALPQTFAIYPAKTGAHKNHMRLLEAIALLRDKHNLIVNLICTGTKSESWPNISERIRELALTGQVNFLGFVEPLELRALYKLAEFLVFPTLFEGGGFPIYEALQEGIAVACSRVTSLPEVAGDAALMFDPMSVEDIARALKQMATDAKLREELRARGKERSSRFTWERTAKAYRALYRKMAGCDLSSEDRLLLNNTEKV